MPPLSQLRVRPLSFALALCLPLIGGCAEERPPINRVQPNALEKSFFVGALSEGSDDPEFYYRPTVVDVDFGAAQAGLFTASYAQTLVRVRWEVAEDALLARLAYDRVDGTSGAVEEGTEGQIVAAFAISSHFDIRRSYNPQTGEELNVIEENTSDRPWYQREFMRVDWSQNLITTAYELDTLAALKMYADTPLSYEPIAYFVDDPSHPDRPFFSPDEGYFDVTNKVYATPELIDTPYGTFTACTFSADIFGGTFPEGNCNPAEVKLRLSFKRVVDTDYEPVHWDGTRMDMFGMFTTATRLGYDRNYGIVDDKWYRFASRHNIWEQSHARDASGQIIACNTDQTTYGDNDPTIDVNPFDGTQDECAAAGAGSRCDRFSQACTVPFRQRETRTIPLYYGPDNDPSLWETSRSVTAEWDSALRHAVHTARYTECIRTGGNLSQPLIDACKAEYPIGLPDALAAVPEILVFCHNPVETGDHPACGTPGLLARVGDLRYGMVNIIQDPQVPSPWGILADAVDPLTGEVVAASINVWNAVTDLQSQSMVDMMRWYNGELSNEDVIAGNFVNSGVAIRGKRSPGWTAPPILSPDEASDRLGSLDRSLVPDEPVEVPKLDQRSMVAWAIQQTNLRWGEQALGSGDGGMQQRFERAKTSGIESALVTQPYQELGGAPLTTPYDEAALDRVSPLRGNFFRFKAELERRQHVALASSGRCMLEAPEPSSVVDLGQMLDAKFPLLQNDAQGIYERNEKWRDYVRRRITHGVLAHEMGHSMGLRHVFTSSFDAINYRPQYWQLRTRDGAENEYCEEPTNDGTDCVGPRWRDPVTETERDGLLYTWAQTSVMDYPGDLTQEMLDIGAYDRAAIRFAYGDVADIWDDPSALCPANGASRSCSRAGDILQDRLDTFGGIGGPWYGGNTLIHYSRLNAELGLIRDCSPADLTPPADWDADRDGAWLPELDGHIVNGSVCQGPPLDHISYSDLQRSAPGFVQVGDFAGDPRKFDELGRVRRPYMFGSDEYADFSNTAVHRSDSGADAYEQTLFYISEYEDRHIWDNYRRNRTNFTLTRSIGRSYGRFLEKLKNLYKGYAFLHEIYSGSGAIEAFLGSPESDGALRGPALATSLTFDHFARVLTRPSAGGHFRSSDVALGDFDVLRSLDQILTPEDPISLVVPDGSTGIGSNVWLGGRPLYNGLDGSKGYWASDYQLFAGSYYDKTQVVELLTEASSGLIDQFREDLSDARYRNVSMATLFPDGVRRLVATSLTQDAGLLGWRAAGRNNDNGSISLLRDDANGPARPLGYRVWWPESGPRDCWPGSNGSSCVGYDDASLELGSAPDSSIALDPEVGWEVQKFIIFWSLAYLPDNWKLDWVDMMRIWVIGTDANPEIPDSERIAWRDPVSGQLYVAHRYGQEEIGGVTVERGIAARVIEWMNVLTREAYEITEEDPLTGELTIARHADDTACPEGKTTCVGQPVETSREYSLRATNYKSVLDFMRQVTATFGFYDPAWRGLYQ
jgi:hypothetical protein